MVHQYMIAPFIHYFYSILFYSIYLFLLLLLLLRVFFRRVGIFFCMFSLYHAAKLLRFYVYISTKTLRELRDKFDVMRVFLSIKYCVCTNVSTMVLWPVLTASALVLWLVLTASALVLTCKVPETHIAISRP